MKILIFGLILQVIFVVLKLFKVINLSWWIVFIPIYPVIIVLLILGVYFLLLINSI
jgi:hypothetical protein